MIRSKTISLQGHTLHYLEAGEGDPVLLLHGFAGSCEEWRTTVGVLARAGYRAIAIDALGFGKSDTPDTAPYSFALFSGLYADLLDALGIERAAFVGHSFGGKCALATAITHPQRVSRLVIADSEGFIPIPLFMKKAGVIPFLGDVFLWMSKNPRLFELQLGGVFYDKQNVPDWLTEHFRSMLASKPHTRAMLQLSRCYDNHDLIKSGMRQRLGEIRCPTLILWGEQDRVFAPACGHTAHNEIPGSHLVILPRAGHYPHLEATRAFHGILLGFLAGMAPQ